MTNKPISEPASRPTPWLGIVGFALAYYGCAHVSYDLSTTQNNTLSFWLPSGLFLGGLLIAERRHWWLLVLAGGVGDLCYNYPENTWPLQYLLLAHLGNSLAAVVGAWLVRRWVADRLALSSLRELVGLVLLGGLVSLPLSATVGAQLLGILHSPASYGSNWISWYCSDLLGVLLLTPALLAWRSATFRPAVWRFAAREFEATGLLTSLIATLGLAYYFHWPRQTETLYLAFPFVIWASLRFGLRGATGVILINALLAAWFTAHGFGLIGSSSLSPSQKIAEIFLSQGVFILVGLLPAIALAAQRRAEAALREKDQVYRDLIENINQSYYVADRRSRFTYCNPALYVMGEFSRDDLAGISCFRLVAEEDRPRVMRAYRQWAGDPAVTEARCEFRAATKAGRRFWVEQATYFLRDHAGRVIEGRNVLRDITERKQTEQRLQLQGAALQAAANAIVITDRDGVIEWVNPAFTALTGYSAGEAVGRNPRDLVKSGRQDDAYYKNLWDTILAGLVWRGEIINRRKDGSLYTEFQTITPVRDERGEISHFITIKENLTERQQAEATLTQTHRRVSVLAQLGRELAEAATPRAAALAIIEAARELLGWDCCWMHYWNEGEQAFENPVNFDLVGGERREIMSDLVYPLKPSPFMRRVMQEGPQLLLRENENEKTEGFLPFGTLRRSLSLMFATIRRDGRLQGVISIQSYSRHAYDQAALDLLQTLADHCAGALARIQTRAALAATEERFRLVWENATDGMRLTNAEGRIVAVNGAFCRIIGKPRNEIEGQFLSVLYAASDCLRILARHQERFAQHNVPAHLEQHLTLWDGRTCWLEVSNCFIETDPARPLLLGIFRDITERKQDEARTREQAEAIDKAPVAIIITDLAHRVTYCNEGATRLYGLTAEQLLRHTADELFTPETMRVLGPGRAATLATGSWRGEVPVETRAGHRITAEFIMSLIRDHAGQPTARLSIAVDITEKKQMAEQVQRMQRLESLGMLAAGIAHDMNNILAPIIMAVPLLKISASDDRSLRMLTTMQKSGERGGALVRQLLSFAHGASGELKLLQVRHVLKDIAEMVAAAFPKTLRLAAELPNDLWPVIGNASQLHQVFLNLCINARDAMPGGGTLHLEAANRRLTLEEARAMPDARPGAFLAVTVADTGTGIPPEILARIWEPFFTTKTPDKGTGLGLSTVRGIVAQHQGFIALQTHVGQGTAFTVYLPADEASVRGEERPASATPLSRGNGELVLVVDDEPPVREMVASTLTQYGYRVLSVGDGAEAVASFAIHAEDVQLVVTDLQMPLLDGKNLVTALLRLRPGLPIVCMSGAAGVSKSMVPFISAFLAKPFTLEALLETAHAALHRPAGSAE